MNTFQLTCFLAVAETLSFARAAEQLHVTQPAVTQQIKSLEKELNVKLFRRNTRTVRMTMAGSAFLEDARHIVSLSRRAVKRFEHPYAQEVQLLSLGCHSYTHLFLLPDALRRLSLIYPNLHPRLQVVPFQHLYRLLEEDDVEAVIGFREPDSRKVPGVYRELKKIPIICLWPSGQSAVREKGAQPERIGTGKSRANGSYQEPGQCGAPAGTAHGGEGSIPFLFLRITRSHDCVGAVRLRYFRPAGSFCSSRFPSRPHPS